MTKEKLQSLTKYASQMKERLNSAVPPKHAHRPEAYKAWLTKELTMTNAKLDAAKFAGTPEKAGK